MALRNLWDMTSEEVDALDRDTTCIFLAVSPIEEHGPHLPLSTDIVEAQGLIERLHARLESDFAQWSFLSYPALPIGVDGFEYPGTACVSARTLRAVVVDIASSFARHGFRRFIVASHHGSPRHNLALEDAARDLARRSDARLLSLAGRVLYDLYLDKGLQKFFDAEGISPEDRRILELDCHAGAFETSEMLALRPDLVRDVWRELAPVVVPLERLTVQSARKEGRGLGYFGAPALADAGLGERYMEFVLDLIYEDVCHFLRDGRTAHLPVHWRAALTALATVSRVRGWLER